MLLLLSLAFVLVKAQIQVPDCLPEAIATWNWTYNSLKQSPCSTPGYLSSECSNGEFTIPQLAQGNNYPGPSGGVSEDICQCNTVLYSVISACAGCQMGIWLSWDDWSANCSSSAPMATFPQSITSSTRVPAWAFLNVTATAPWDNITSCSFSSSGGFPESVGTFRPSFAPQYSAGAHMRAGVIAGVVVGATVAGLLAIAAGVWYLVRRRRQRTPISNKRPPPNGGTERDVTGSGYESVPWTPQSDKFYDPSDPSTYPDLAVLPGNTSIAGAMSLNTSNGAKAQT